MLLSTFSNVDAMLYLQVLKQKSCTEVPALFPISVLSIKPRVSDV